jgi:glyceraldehyde 3-phosphate dehydrogenase
MKVIDELCGIKPTSLPFIPTDQSLHDQTQRFTDEGQSIVPTTTGAAKALTKFFLH